MEDKPYKFQSLLVRSAANTVSAPISPAFATRSLEEATGFKGNRLIRVSFRHPFMYQINEGTKRDCEWTGHDTLVSGRVCADKRVHLSFFVDMGAAVLPVALWLEKDNIVYSEIYQKMMSKFNYVLSEEQLCAMLQDLRMRIKRNPPAYHPDAVHQDRLEEIPLGRNGQNEGDETISFEPVTTALRKQLPHQDGNGAGSNTRPVNVLGALPVD